MFKTTHEHLSHRDQKEEHASSDKPWLDLQYHENKMIKKPEDLEQYIQDPPMQQVDSKILDRIHGSMAGMALGDALGAHVEFRPHQYLTEHPVTDLEGGGTWGLQKGQFTDDTSMALCLANSLVTRQDYDPYDQLVRYKWWFRHGYMSSTGQCFDIGSATKQSLVEFEHRQKTFAEKYKIPLEKIDLISDSELFCEFDVKCSEKGVAGNGALMRLAPVPLFFYRHPTYAIEYSGHSGEITHGDQKAYDACRYYGALIVAAIQGTPKKDLLNENFYTEHKNWFNHKTLHPDVENIMKGSYQKKEGYDKGIRGKGYVIDALEAALWAFWSDGDCFKTGVLKAVNLGDDTDTTAAIYGQLAGACYGYSKLPKEWVNEVYAKKFMECLSKWIAYEGQKWSPQNLAPSTNPSLNAPENDQRPRRNSTLDPNSALKPPDSDESSGHDRRQSIDYGLLESQPQPIYIHKTMKTPDDVYNWFKHFPAEYMVYGDALKKNDIDGYWLLNQIDDKRLAKYGIKDKDHRQVVLADIEKLKKECPTKYGTVGKKS